MSGSSIQKCEINDLLHDGRGVGRINGKAYFVDGALPDENVAFSTIKQKRNFAEGRMVEVLSASPFRREPACQYFSRCGGCNLQHLDHDRQIDYKQGHLVDALNRSNIYPDRVIKPLKGAQWGYRRRARLAVQRTRDNKILLGFKHQKSNRIEPIESCLVIAPALDIFLVELPTILAAIENIKLFEVELVAGDSQTAVAISASRSLSDSESDRLLSRFRSVDGEVQLWWKNSTGEAYRRLDDGNGHLSYITNDDVLIQFKPGQFIQVNSDINSRMIEQVLNLVAPSLGGLAIDLFCGSGNLTLPLTKQFNQVVGVEGFADLVEAAKINAQNNKITNVNFVASDLTKSDELRALMSNKGPIDLIVLDPPRNGASGVMPWVAESGARQIIYISCHSATMIRDIRLLHQAGYTLSTAGVMDMFPHTSHIESMAIFKK